MSTTEEQFTEWRKPESATQAMAFLLMLSQGNREPYEWLAKVLLATDYRLLITTGLTLTGLPWVEGPSLQGLTGIIEQCSYLKIEDDYITLLSLPYLDEMSQHILVTLVGVHFDFEFRLRVDDFLSPLKDLGKVEALRKAGFTEEHIADIAARNHEANVMRPRRGSHQVRVK